jgi:hypothetical protein
MCASCVIMQVKLFYAFMNMSAHSIVDYRSEHGGYRCGYCGSPNTNYSCGMSSNFDSFNFCLFAMKDFHHFAFIVMIAALSNNKMRMQLNDACKSISYGNE